MRLETHSAAVSTAGFFDSVSGGLYSKLAGAFGANVSQCSADYQQGQIAGLPYNVALIAFTGGGDVAADAAVSRQVLVDSNLVPALAKDPTLGGLVADGEQAVVSYVTRPELRNVVLRGKGLRGVPRILDTIPVLEQRPSLDTIITRTVLIGGG